MTKVYQKVRILNALKNYWTKLEAKKSGWGSYTQLGTFTNKKLVDFILKKNYITCIIDLWV